MSSLQYLLDNHFQNLSGNLIYDTVKVVWKTCTQKSIEDMYIDACEQALQEIQPYLSQHINDGELQFNREDFRRILIYELNLDRPTYDLRQSSVVEAMAKAVADKDVLEIGGHTLSDDVYMRFVQQLLHQASNKLGQTIHRNEEIFHKAIMEAHDASDEKARAILSTLSQQYEVIVDIRDKIVGMDSKIDSLVAVQRSSTTPDVTISNQSLSRSAILQIFKSSSSGLRFYKHTISHTEISLEQPEVQQILDWIFRPDSSQSACLFTGDKGAGKSVVLRNVLVALEVLDKSVVAIQASTIGGLIEELPASVEDCIRRITEDSDCVVIIDQLDNLADALNRNQDALVHVLDLVARIRNIPRARVVLACRKFEIKHDPVLSSLAHDNKIHQIRLGKLPDNEVNKVLLYLCKPQLEHLSKVHQNLLKLGIFLDIYARIVKEESNTDVADFNNLTQLYQRYWEVVFDYRKYPLEILDKCEQLVNVLVDEMQNKQVHELPKAVIRQYPQQSDYLRSMGFIQVSQNKVKFLHQTLLTYCFARKYVGTTHLLSRDILDSAQSFFHRAQVKQVFILLRDHDEIGYQTELENFLFVSAHAIRYHLRLLLIYWIGEQRTPTQEEQDILLRLYRNKTTLPAVLIAIRGNVTWLRFLAQDIKDNLKKDDPKLNKLHYNYFMSFKVSAPKDVIEMLYSLYETTRSWDGYIINYLTLIDDWSDPRSHDIAFDLLERGLLGTQALGHILNDLSESNLGFGCNLLITHLEMLFEQLKEKQQTEEFTNWSWMRSPFPILDDDGTHDFFAKVAELEPGLILKHFLIWFIKALHQLSSYSDPHLKYYHSSDIAFWFYTRSLHGHRTGINLREAINIALKRNTDTFSDIIESLQQSKYMIIHNLIADILISHSQKYAEIGYTYIAGDKRRLKLDRSNELLESIFPNISDEQRVNLEQMIYDIQSGDLSEPTLEQWQHNWERRQREQFRLIYFIPEHLLTPKARWFKYELEEKLKPYKPSRYRKQTGTSTTSVSPLPLDKLKLLSDHDYLRVLRRYDVSTSRYQPTRNRQADGGSVDELSQEVGKHALEDPIRLYQLSQLFDDSISEAYIATIIGGIVQSVDNPAHMYIDILNRFGENITGETRISICRSISSRNGETIPNHLLDLLSDWAMNDLNPEPDSQQSAFEMLRHTTDRTDGFYNRAINSVRSLALEAYCKCVFASDSLNLEKVFHIISQATDDPSLAVRVMAMQQLGIWHDRTKDKGKTIAIMQQLIKGHEIILSSHIVQNMVRWLCFHDFDLALTYLDQMLISEHERTCQAGSEIVCVNSFHINTLTSKARKLVKHSNENIRKGAARIFARNLEFSTLDDTCLTHLRLLIHDESPEVRREVGLGFGYLKQAHFVRFHDYFRDFIKSPALEGGGLHLVLYLAKLRLTTEDDRLVLDLANLIIENHEQILQGHNLSRGISTKDFIMILLGVHARNDHRLEIQSEVMDIFDKLLELNNYEVEQMFADEDDEWSIA